VRKLVSQPPARREDSVEARPDAAIWAGSL
jgi:hypothetical protein